MAVVAADKQMTIGRHRRGVAGTAEREAPAHLAVGVSEVHFAARSGEAKVIAGDERHAHRRQLGPAEQALGANVLHTLQHRYLVEWLALLVEIGGRAAGGAVLALD